SVGERRPVVPQAPPGALALVQGPSGAASGAEGCRDSFDTMSWARYRRWYKSPSGRTPEPDHGDRIMTTTTARYVALELSPDKWLLACATAAAEKPRFRPVPARDLKQLDQEIARAKDRFGLAADAPVYTCYEAGRDGFWLHRALSSRGIDDRVVDSTSIEVDRRRKRAKTDPVDAARLLN